MDRRSATSPAKAWRHWFLVLTLCVFAFAYGAPTGMTRAMPAHVAVTGDCPEAAGHGGKPAHAASSACCIAHCLPAAPQALPSVPLPRGGTGETAERPDERGEGRAPAVPLPPPRGADRA